MTVPGRRGRVCVVGLVTLCAGCIIVRDDGRDPPRFPPPPPDQPFDAGPDARAPRPDGATTPPPSMEPVTASALVSAATGGTVALDDGTSLTIPAGALAEDTMITVSRPADGVLGAGLLGAVELAPDGLVLSSPATLTVAYDASRNPDTDRSLYVMSGLNTLGRSSGEVNPFDVVEGATDDGAAMSASISHFSWYSIVVHRRVVLALEIPGQYLHDGDILFAATGGVGYVEATDRPLHVGMFVENATGGSVIESTLPDFDCTPSYLEGVEQHAYDGDTGFRRLCGSHIFFGARRPSVPVTREMRQRAVAAAGSRRGQPYGILALNNSDRVGIIAGGLSCVELTEDSWEEAGVNISWTPDALLWPHDQFENTVPVSELTMKVSDPPLVVPVVGAAHLALQGREGVYNSVRGTPMELTVTASPDVFGAGRASLTAPIASMQAIRDLVFAPTEEDVGTRVVFTFDLRVPSTGATARETLTVTVEAAPPPPGPECPVSSAATTVPLYRGTLAGTTTLGGAFANDAWVTLVRVPDGRTFVHVWNVDATTPNGALAFNWPMPFAPTGGGTQTVTHPMMAYDDGPDGSSPAQRSWSYWCSLDGVSEYFGTFDTFSGIAEVTPSSDCSTLSLHVEQMDTQYSDRRMELLTCGYSATFTGTLDDGRTP